MFLLLLRLKRKWDEYRIKNQFSEAIVGKNLDSEIEDKLNNLSFDLEIGPTDMQASILRKNFPSGNYLLHTTHVGFAIEAIKEGNLVSAEEISRRKKMPAGFPKGGFGGGAGIRFNMNNVSVLTGEGRHFMGFLISPEAALATSEDYSLVKPQDKGEYDAAQYEVALLSKNNLPKIPLSESYILASRSDLNDLKKVCAAYGLLPKGIMYYSPTSLRVESWTDPIAGDHEMVGKMLKKNFAQAGLEPTIDWEHGVFPLTPSAAQKSTDVIMKKL